MKHKRQKHFLSNYKSKLPFAKTKLVLVQDSRHHSFPRLYILCTGAFYFYFLKTFTECGIPVRF